MNMWRDIILFATLATVPATPALTQTAAPTVGPVGNAAHGAAAVPDFSHVWSHPALAR
jgi:hypothetical protein